MAAPGRLPSETSVNRNPKLEWVEVVDVPYGGARPALPKRRSMMTKDGRVQVALLAMTRQWWETISTMPHCVLWRQSDWAYALATALVADAAFSGVATAQRELRQREEGTLGVTVESRRQLRIRYVPARGMDDDAPTQDVVAPPANLDEARRRRLADA